MDRARREILKWGGGAGAYAMAAAAGLTAAGGAGAQVPGWNKAAFDSKSYADTLKALRVTAPVESGAVVFANPTPDIAENGAVVPIAVMSKLPNTESISILVARNPNTLAASFVLGPAMEPFISTRVKMAETSDVIALVKADGKYYYARKEVKVTIGGCGV